MFLYLKASEISTKSNVNTEPEYIKNIVLIQKLHPDYWLNT